MNFKTLVRSTFLLAGLVVATGFSTVSIVAQESVRTIDQPGDFTKYLTPGMVDRWIFQGVKNETVIAHVTTQEFDSVIQLVRAVQDQEVLLIEVDDDGSDGWLSFRLPEDGKYKICIRGYENRGGGNYSMSLRQIRATATEPGKTESGAFDRNGKAFYYFQATAEQHFTVDVKGNSSNSWGVLNTQGKPVPAWYRMVSTEKSGEYLIELNGRSGLRYQATLRTAETGSWPEDPEVAGKLSSRNATVIDLPAETGEFRLLELFFTGDLVSRIVYAPRQQKDEGQAIGNDNQRPEMTFLPIGNKGTTQRYAVVWGRNDRFQLHLFSESGAEFRATYRDPAIPVESNSAVTEVLEVGNSRFFRVQLQQGETITVRATTTDFDPVLRLYSESGEQIAADDDGGGMLNCQLQHSAYRKETVLLAVESVGNGGGGEFKLNVKTEEARRVVVNEVQTGTPQPGATEQWLFSAKAGQSIIFHVNGGNERPRFLLRNSRGVDLANVAASDEANDAVLLYKFPDADDYSIWVSVGNGASYTLNAIEVNQNDSPRQK